MFSKLFHSSGGVGWIVVFLGNPGPKYSFTRHNVGFMTADAAERDTGVKIARSRFKALTAETRVGKERVLLMKPQTFMNLSGDAAIQAVNFYKVPPERVIVVSDEAAFPVGKLRVRAKGSAGGHNGLKSLIARLGTEEFPRVRIGVGAPPHPDWDMADWVTGSFKNQDAADIAAVTGRAWEAVKSYILFGPDKTMSDFN